MKADYYKSLSVYYSTLVANLTANINNLNANTEYLKKYNRIFFNQIGVN